MTKPNPAVEPSMEEILASIRRIISDGDENPGEGLQPQGDQDAPADNAENDGREPVAMSGSEEPAETASEDGEADENLFELTDEMLADVPAGEVEASHEGGDPDAVMADESTPDAGLAGSGESDDGAGEPDLVFGSASAEAEPRAPEHSEREAETVHETYGHGGMNGARSLEDGEPAGGGAGRLLSAEADASVASAFGRLTDTMLSKESRTIEDLVRELLRPMLKEWLDDNLPPLVERLVREEIERVSRGRP